MIYNNQEQKDSTEQRTGLVYERTQMAAEAYSRAHVAAGIAATHGFFSSFEKCA